MTDKTTSMSAALARAKVFLGPRVRVYKEDGLCVIARAEMTQEGTRYRRIYGCADTWAEALAAAAESYAVMRRHPERTT